MYESWMSHGWAPRFNGRHPPNGADGADGRCKKTAPAPGTQARVTPARHIPPPIAAELLRAPLPDELSLCRPPLPPKSATGALGLVTLVLRVCSRDLEKSRYSPGTRQVRVSESGHSSQKAPIRPTAPPTRAIAHTAKHRGMYMTRSGTVVVGRNELGNHGATITGKKKKR